MSDKAVIDTLTGVWLKGPYCEADAYIPGLGETVIEVAEGWPDKLVWSASTKTFAPPPLSITAFEYLMLFTPTEQIAALSSDDPRMKLALMLTYTSPTINLGNEQVIEGLNLMVSLGILTAPRAMQVLAAQPPAA